MCTTWWTILIGHVKYFWLFLWPINKLKLQSVFICNLQEHLNCVCGWCVWMKFDGKLECAFECAFACCTVTVLMIYFCHQLLFKTILHKNQLANPKCNVLICFTTSCHNFCFNYFWSIYCMYIVYTPSFDTLTINNINIIKYKMNHCFGPVYAQQTVI